MRSTWEAAWQEQQAELRRLEELLSVPNDGDELKSETEEERLDLVALWSASQNKSEATSIMWSKDSRADSGEDGVARARQVTQRLMRYWRTATPRNDNLDPYARRGRETMTRNIALAERRRQLRRHVAAGCVEYRIFGEELSRDEQALDALSCAGLETLVGAWTQLGGVARRVGWVDAESFVVVSSPPPPPPPPAPSPPQPACGPLAMAPRRKGAGADRAWDSPMATLVGSPTAAETVHIPRLRWVRLCGGSHLPTRPRPRHGGSREGGRERVLDDSAR